MKKLIFILLSVITLSSCTESTVKITDETTELPNKVVKSLDDTTLVKQYAIIETDDKLYLLTNKLNEKKFYVDKTIQKEAASEFLYLVIVILGAIIFFMLLGLLDR
jgi:hypothetical protein